MNGITIFRFNVRYAEAYKEEKKSLLDHMEENQDLLLYFSLMEFRQSLPVFIFKSSIVGFLRNLLIL